MDPAEPKKVLQKAKQEGVKVVAIATTHHHSDHAGGNDELLSLVKPETIPVYAGDDRISPTNKVCAAIQSKTTVVGVEFIDIIKAT